MKMNVPVNTEVDLSLEDFHIRVTSAQRFSSASTKACGRVNYHTFAKLEDGTEIDGMRCSVLVLPNKFSTGDRHYVARDYGQGPAPADGTDRRYPAPVRLGPTIGKLLLNAWYEIAEDAQAAARQDAQDLVESQTPEDVTEDMAE